MRSYDATHCFVCGRDNPIGLKIQFQPYQDGVRATFVPTDLHVGYPGVVHGGILAALVDDALASIWHVRGQPAVTGRIEVRFRHPVRPGDHLVVTALPTGSRGGLHTGQVVITRDGTVVARGAGVVAVRPP
jgi:uncharacterized protein (TIGR00369 family)